MPNTKLATPVLLIAFNRPDMLRMNLERLSVQQPKKLYVSIDGPRPNNSLDSQAIAEIHTVLDSIRWKCDVHTLFHPQNLGCMQAVASALNWFFENETEGIILEDDCIPSSSFFQFCEELLAKYRNNLQISHINGSAFVPYAGRESYTFSYHPFCWGWATWKRAWKDYNPEIDISSLPQLASLLESKLQSHKGVQAWMKSLQHIASGKLNTWDYQWVLHVWKQDGITVSPRSNLISNIGFDVRATHTKLTSPLASLPLTPLRFPLRHPKTVRVNHKHDKDISKLLYETGFVRKLIRGFQAKIRMQRAVQHHD